MNRREFLVQSTMAAIAASRVRAQTPDSAKLARVAIMTYSFDRIVKVEGRPADPARTLDLFDTPEMYADRYKVHNVERSTITASTSRHTARVPRGWQTKSRLTNINLEFGNASIGGRSGDARATSIGRSSGSITPSSWGVRVMVNQGVRRRRTKTESPR